MPLLPLQGPLTAQQEPAQQPGFGLPQPLVPRTCGCLLGPLQTLVLGMQDAELLFEEVRAALGDVQAVSQTEASGTPGRSSKGAHGPDPCASRRAVGSMAS